MSVLSSRWRRATLAGVIAVLGLVFGAGAAQATSPVSSSVELDFSTAPANSGGNHASVFANNPSPVTIKNVTHPETQSGTGWAGLNGVLQIGDVIEVDVNGPGGAVFTQTFDGKPTLDSTVCAGKNSFGGTFTAGVPTTAASDIPATYAPSQQATPTNNSANNTYSGAFPKPIGAGDYVLVQGYALALQTNNGVTLALYESATTFPPKCPAAPAPAPAPAPKPTPPPAPTGSLTHGGVFQLGSFDQLHAIRDLFNGGLLFGFVVDDPTPGPDALAIVLVPANTNPPAQAAKNKKHKKHTAKKSKILARGAVTVTAPGTITVKVLPTAYGRKFLKHHKKQNVTVVDTLKNKQTGVSKTLTFPLALQK